MRHHPIPRLATSTIISGKNAIFALILACLGCSSDEKSSMTPQDVTRAVPGSAAPLLSTAGAGDAPTTTPAETKASSNGAEVPPEARRKIIYNAQVTLIVKSLTGFNAKLDTLVKSSGGYISATDQSSQTEAQRNGSWTIRVPVERFNHFLAAVSELGELQRSHLDSQDVTMEYYDLEARIKNKQEEEKRLLKHLADSTGKLDDILSVERELTRVRGEVEQMQGRIRFLGNQAALSTVTLTVSEIQNYIPPTQPTFAGQIARTFHESLSSLIAVGKALILFAVALAPWLPVLLVLGLILFWAVRKANRQRPPVVLNRTNTP